MTPRPPLLLTAEARGAVEVWAMPATVVFLQVIFFPFGGSTGAPRHCLGAPDPLEQRNNGLEKSYGGLGGGWRGGLLGWVSLGLVFLFLGG